MQGKPKYRHLAILSSLIQGGGGSNSERLPNLIITGRRVERLEEITAHLTSEYGVEVTSLKLDVRNKEEVIEALGQIPSSHTNIDILINNAGLAAGFDHVFEASTDDWDLMIDTNLKGLLYVTRAVLPGMIKRNAGHILNIASTAGHIVYPGGSVYCATKHAVRAVAKTLQLELMEYAIKVSSVDPGIVKTEFSNVRFKGDKDKSENVYKGFTPLSAEDVADAVSYCVTRPPHVMVGEMVLLATAQGDGRTVSRSE
jgi:3-hydroxy acid dehydrogenase / malonic semialdehyde reductase